MSGDYLTPTHWVRKELRWEHALSTWHVYCDDGTWVATNFDTRDLHCFRSQRAAMEYADREGVASFASLPAWMQNFAFDDASIALAKWRAAIGSDKT